MALVWGKTVIKDLKSIPYAVNFNLSTKYKSKPITVNKIRSMALLVG